MKDTIEFKSLRELYERVKPALYSKSKEIKRMGFRYVTENDIWNYLVLKSWKNRSDLELYDLISDIIHADNYSINEYVMNKLNSLKSKDDVIIIDDKDSSDSLF